LKPPFSPKGCERGGGGGGGGGGSERNRTAHRPKSPGEKKKDRNKTIPLKKNKKKKRKQDTKKRNLQQIIGIAPPVRKKPSNWGTPNTKIPKSANVSSHKKKKRESGKILTITSASRLERGPALDSYERVIKGT